MHSSLKVVDFSQFPVELEVSPYRGHSNLSERPEHRAKEAARGSFESLESLVDVLFDDSHQVPKAFVALIYQVLHSIRIPSLEEEHTGKTYAVAVHAVSALRCLVRVADAGLVQEEAKKDIWAIARPWTIFLGSFLDLLGAGDFRLAVGAVCIGMSYAYCPKDGVELWMMTLVGKTLQHWSFGAGIENANLVALMEGLGGSWEDLAALTVTLLKWMVPTEETQVTRDLRPGLIFVSCVVREHLEGSESEFRDALWAHGFLAAAVRASISLNNAVRTDKGWRLCAHSLFNACQMGLTDASTVPRLIPGLRAGLLRAALSYAWLNHHDPLDLKGHDALGGFFCLLSGYSSSRTALVAIDSAVRGLGVRAEEALEGRETDEAWVNLLGVVRERRTILDSMEEGGVERRVACDHVECGLIRERRKMKRCRKCESRWYCDKSCQAADWRAEDGHKTECNSLRGRRAEDKRNFPAKERAFWPRLLDHMYKEVEEDVAVLVALFYRKYGAEATPIVLFDGFRGRPEPAGSVSVMPVHRLEGVWDEEGSWAKRDLARVQRRCALGSADEGHVLILWDGSVAGRVIPLRREPPAKKLTDGLKEMAGGRGDEAEIRRQVKINFGEIPFRMRGKVKGAAAGSLEDLTALAFVLDPRGGYKLEPFVPLVYAVLRDLGIPSLEDLQVTKVLGVVAHAMLALEWLVKLVRAGVVEKGAMLDFWTIAEPWVNLAECFADSLRDGDGRMGFWKVCFESLRVYAANSELHSLRLMNVIGKCANLMLDRGTESYVLNVTTTLDVKKIGDQVDDPNFLAVLDGLGGSWEDLAGWVVKYLRWLVPTSETELPPRWLPGFALIQRLLGTTSEASEDFREALWARELGLMEAATIASVAVNRAARDDDRWRAAADILVNVLGSGLSQPQMVRGLVVGLDAGLLRALELYSKMNEEGSSLFLRVLLAFSSSRVAVTALFAALQGLDVDPDELFKGDVVRWPWRDLVYQVNSRASLIGGGGGERRVACDHVECGLIAERRKMKRCGNCESRWYCDKICQTADWRAEDGHKVECEKLRSKLHEDKHSFPGKDRAFWAVLMSQLYGRLQPTVGLALVHFWVAHGPEATPHVRCDTTGAVSAKLGEVRMYTSAEEAIPAEVGLEERAALQEEIDRVKRRCELGGADEVHILIAWDGCVVARVMPLRREPRATALVKGLKEIARLARDSGEGEAHLERYQTEVDALVGEYTWTY
ncbi:hypothetical protein C8F01DRAFT_1249463 [Mycena amicta]|nr:hypothetical protein C8F01DRAFT_1249463 [Mycena amicta]